MAARLNTRSDIMTHKENILELLPEAGSDGLTMKQIHEKLGGSKATLEVVLKKMLDEGLVSRKKVYNVPHKPFAYSKKEVPVIREGRIQEIFDLLDAGVAVGEIAKQVGVDHSTVIYHRRQRAGTFRRNHRERIADTNALVEPNREEPITLSEIDERYLDASIIGVTMTPDEAAQYVAICKSCGGLKVMAHQVKFIDSMIVKAQAQIASLEEFEKSLTLNEGGEIKDRVDAKTSIDRQMKGWMSEIEKLSRQRTPILKHMTDVQVKSAPAPKKVEVEVTHRAETGKLGGRYVKADVVDV